MEPKAYLRCLGQPILVSAQGQTIRFRTKKHLALLAYLVVEGQRLHRRDRLAELLWPKVGVAEGRHSLATALSVLRSKVGSELIVATREHVSFVPGSLITDLDRLVQGDVLGDTVGEPLEVAPFLEGFDVPDTTEFALWKDRQQARLLPLISSALILLIEHSRRTGDTRQIELLADRMLALDELSEEAIRAKMEARALAGDRLTALKVFEAWKQKLAAELKAVPSQLVEGMAVRLRRRGWERTTLTNIPTVPTDQWRGRPFCGRTREYRLLYEAWERTQSGKAMHALVLGDSGIGKTTLVERFTTAVGLEGAAVTRVQCYGLDQHVPYATLGGLVKGLLDQPGVSTTLPESLAELARIVPEVRRRFSGLPPSPDNFGETARIRYSECFHDMLMAIAEEHPVILVVDDLHLSDETSLAVLHLVVRRSVGRPLMVIMIARPHDLATSPQACRLRDGGRNLGIQEIECLPLGTEESLEVLSALAAESTVELSMPMRRALVHAAAGFPMVLDLLYQDWNAHGSQSLALALRGMTAELRGSSAPPQIYREVLERLLRSMDAVTQTVLNIASILGPRLNEISYYRIADLTVGQTMTGLAELVSRRVLRDGGKGLEFVNELLRTAAYLGVPSPLRRALHSSIADQLVKADDQASGSSGLEVAWHCMRAGRQIEATRYLMSGAREAIRAGATEETERALSTALPGLAGDERSDASLLLAEVLQEQGRPNEALELLSSLKGVVSGLRAERAVALEALAYRYVATSTSPIREMIAPLGEVVRSSSDAPTRTLAARAMAYLLLELGDHRLMIDLLEVLSQFPPADLDVDSIGHLALARALLLYQVGDAPASYAQATAAVVELKRRGAANLVTMQLQCGIGSLLSCQGKYDAAMASFKEALGMANRLGNDPQVARLCGNIALCYGRLGHYAEQLEWASKVGALRGPSFMGFLDIQVAYSRSFALVMLGKPQEALKTLEEMDARLANPMAAWQMKAWSLWKADILQLAGRTAEALEAARSAVTDLSFGLETPAFAGPFARWLQSTDSRVPTKAVGAKLAEMISNLERYDTLDQAEILCAYRLHAGDRFTGDLWVQLESKLCLLPQPVTTQLTSLGALPTH